jgi:hypothetical protein
MDAALEEARDEMRADATETPGLLVSMTYICAKCTRFRQFAAESKLKCQLAAKQKGWRIVGGRPICKRCPG